MELHELGAGTSLGAEMVAVTEVEMAAVVFVVMAADIEAPADEAGEPQTSLKVPCVCVCVCVCDRGVHVCHKQL